MLVCQSSPQAIALCDLTFPSLLSISGSSLLSLLDSPLLAAFH